MAIAVSVGQTKRFVTESDRSLPEDQQTVFLLRPLTARERAAVQDLSVLDTADNSVKLRVGTIHTLTVEKGLTGWSNFRDAAGTEMLFDAKNVAANLDRLSPDDLVEIYGAIADMNTVTKEQEKN